MKAIPALVCPSCKAKLDRIDKVTFRCNSCCRTYPIVDDIAMFAATDDFYEEKFTDTVYESRNTRLFEMLHYFFYREKTFFKKWIPRNCTLLDLACGGGKELFSKLANITVGIDISKRATENAKIIYSLVTQGSIMELPFEAEMFDVVVTSHVIGHIPFDQKEFVLNEIFRVLKPGGRTIHVIETDSLHPMVKLGKSYPHLYRLNFIDRYGHYGLELASAAISRFQSVGFELISHKRMDAGIAPIWYYEQYFKGTELEEQFSSIRWRIILSQWLHCHKYPNFLYGVIYGLYHDTLEQRMAPLDRSMHIAVCFRKPFRTTTTS